MRWLALAMMVGSVAAGCTAPVVPGADSGVDAFTPPMADSGVDAFTPPPTDSGVDAAIDVDTGVPPVDSGMPPVDGGTTGFAVMGSLGTLGGVVSGSTFQVLGGQLESIGESCAGTICVTGRVGP